MTNTQFAQNVYDFQMELFGHPDEEKEEDEEEVDVVEEVEEKKAEKSENLKEALLPYKQIIYKWMSDNEICKHPDKKSSLLWDIIKCIHDTELGPGDFQEIIEKCKNNDITITEGCLWEKLKEHFEDKHITFLKCISNICPRGLSTSPNADCGKFELLYRLLRPGSRQPSKGDVSDNGEKIEIKGSGVRFQVDKGGEQYIKETNKLFEITDIIGNSPKTGGLKGTQQYEIEKSQYEKHYSDQFCKDIPKSHAILKEYFKIHNIDYTDDDIEDMFKGGTWNQSILQKLWLKKMFIITLGDSDKMIIFGNGENVKVLKNKEDLDKLIIYSDFFRINKTANVGYYIK